MNTADLESCQFESDSPDDTIRLAGVIARHLQPGTLVALRGTLGAGKTFLVQSIAAARGIDRNLVNSPTFALIQQYPGTPSLIHIDAYRIGDGDEFMELGIDELLDGPAIVLMEWADKFIDFLPADRLELSIDVRNQTGRRFRLAWPTTDSRATGVGRAIRQDLELMA